MHVHVRSPLVLKSIQANLTLRIHVQMVDTAGKCHFGCVKWVGFREGDQ